MKSNARMIATLAVVISLFVWAAAASPAHAQKKKADGANKAAKQADREAKKEEREAAKEERAAKKEERQAKKKERQDARGDSAQSVDAANGGTAKKSRRANAAGQPGTDNLSGGDDPFGAKGKPKAKGKRAADSQQAGADATGEGEVAPEATQDATTAAGVQPSAKGRRAKAKAAATASGASTEATTTTGATGSSVGGDTPAAVETPVEQPEATESASAGGGKDGTDQKFMKAARQDLNKALNALKRASADKGGHRERAVDLVGQAVAEIDKGMAYDKQNPNDRQRERPAKRSELPPRGDDVDGASGVRLVAASWAAQKPSEQPNMQLAKTHLQSALSNLDRATADKGGFRVNAVRLARAALNEVEQGIAYDNTHKVGN